MRVSPGGSPCAPGLQAGGGPISTAAGRLPLRRILQARPTKRGRVEGEILAKDPICNMDVDEGKAASSSTHKGKTYYFCCEGCKKEFDASPEKYLPEAVAAARR